MNISAHALYHAYHLMMYQIWSFFSSFNDKLLYWDILFVLT